MSSYDLDTSGLCLNVESTIGALGPLTSCVQKGHAHVPRAEVAGRELKHETLNRIRKNTLLLGP